MLPNWGKFFVADNDGFLVGCCALDIYSKRIAEVRSLAVMSVYQDKGVGKDLVQACVDRAKKEGIYEIFAVTSSERFFEKLGFNTFNNEKKVVFQTL